MAGRPGARWGVWGDKMPDHDLVSAFRRDGSLVVRGLLSGAAPGIAFRPLVPQNACGGSTTMHVRVCVECGEEYRPEIVACADCGGRLEDRTDEGERTVVPDAAPAERPPDPDAEFTEAVLHAERAGDLRSEADRLVEAEIDFRLRPSRGAGYRLLVAAADRDRALDVLGLLADPGSAADAARSCPACGVAVRPEVADCPECGLAVGDEPDPED